MDESLFYFENLQDISMIINNRWCDAGLDDPVVEERMGSGAPDDDPIIV